MIQFEDAPAWARVRTAACAATLALLIAPSAQAALVVDQSNFVPTELIPSGGFVASSAIKDGILKTYQSQTVTAGEAGLLSRIDLQLFQGTHTAPLYMKIYDGDFAGAADIMAPPGSPGGFGMLKGTISIPVASLPTQSDVFHGAFASLDVSSFGFYVSPGQVFSIMLETHSPDWYPVANWALGYYTDQNDADTFVGLSYADGYNASTLFDYDSYVRTGSDRSFRTWVDVPSVPEPQVWALMIVGFGLAGATLRRQRLAEA